MKSSTTDKDSLLNIEDQLCFALYSTSRAITKHYAPLLEAMGVTYPQYLTLMVLWTQDGLTIREVADRLELEAATTTPLVQRLEKLGLVSRQRSTEDERRVNVFLTTKGKRYYQKARPIPEAARCSVGVSKTKAKELISEMRAIKNFIASVVSQKKRE